MPRRKSESTSEILEFLFDVAQLLPRPLEAPYAWVRRVRRLQYKEYYSAMYKLHKRGVVKIYNKEGKNFIQLTEKGALELLFEKAALDHTSPPDGKWRVIVYDIPEVACLERDRFRCLLKRHGFLKIQASVFVHYRPLNRAAIEYLHKSGLHKYIRIMKVEEMDNDEKLKKHFSL
jgi:CRISPR-associated endonuclease Cas2